MCCSVAKSVIVSWVCEFDFCQELWTHRLLPFLHIKRVANCLTNINTQELPLISSLGPHRNKIFRTTKRVLFWKRYNLVTSPCILFFLHKREIPLCEQFRKQCGFGFCFYHPHIFLLVRFLLYLLCKLFLVFVCLYGSIKCHIRARLFITGFWIVFDDNIWIKIFYLEKCCVDKNIFWNNK